MNNKEIKMQIGDKFQKGMLTLEVTKISRGNAILERAYRMGRKMFEEVSINHILSCPTMYKKI